MASSTRMQNYIERLSEELRLQICEFLPNSALKNLGLASKRWRKTSSTLLWKTFEYDLHRYSQFHDLILSLPDGILESVKNFKIITPPGNSTAIMQLVSCLARNTLRTVEFTGVGVKVLDLLFCSQHLIEKFTFREDSERPLLLNRFILAHSLKQLRDLKMTSKIQNNDYDFRLSNTPALETLSLGSDLELGTRYADPVRLNISNHVYRMAPLRLRRLSLVSLVLVNGAKCLGGTIDLPSLEALDLIQCRGVSPFLREFSKLYTSSTESTLKSLNVTHPFEEAELVESLDQFIGCVTGLETLFIATQESRRINVHEICRHGQTLRFLHLDPLYCPEDLTWTEISQCYTPKELGTLAAGCPHIEELGVHAAFIDIDLIGHGASFSISDTEDVAKALDALAHFRSLRSLRLTHLFALNEFRITSYLHLRAGQFCRLAGELMQYLVERGSSIEIFAASPTAGVDPEEMGDDFQGHSWPHYYYVRGTVTIPFRHQHRTQVQAIPVTEDNITDYVQLPSLLFRTEVGDIKIYR